MFQTTNQLECLGNPQKWMIQGGRSSEKTIVKLGHHLHKFNIIQSCFTFALRSPKFTWDRHHETSGFEIWALLSQI